MESEKQARSSDSEKMSFDLLPANVLYNIMLHLSTKVILHCQRVCKTWKALLSEKYFWKMFLSKNFDLRLETDIGEEDPYSAWNDPEKWFCYYDDETDAYVMKPFPTMWKCRVIHPFGLDAFSGDAKKLQGLSRALEILVRMRDGIKSLELYNGNQCSANEGENGICVVLFPWEKKELPTTKEIMTDIFHIHPEVCHEVLANTADWNGLWRHQKLYYHYSKGNDEDDYEAEDHDQDRKPCLNRIFGFSSYGKEESEVNWEEVETYYKWLQNVMVPSYSLVAADGKFNPVMMFSLTKLAPGWMGGALSGATYT